MKLNKKTIIQYLHKFSRKNILVVGDVILDHYILGKVDRISPEAPVPVVWANQEKFVCGGSANVGLNLVSLGAKSGVCGVMGKDHFGEVLTKLMKDGGIDTKLLICDKNRPTTIKTRIRAAQQQIVRVDWESLDELSLEINESILSTVKHQINQFDAVIIEDYGKGVINSNLVADLVELCRANDKIVTVDPKEENIEYYRHVTSLTPNLKEAQTAADFKVKNKAQIPMVGEIIMSRLRPKSLLITLGEDGMMLFEPGKKPYHIPTAAQEVFDVSGAGDTVIAVFTLALSCGASYPEAAYIANLAAGIVVGKLGTATVDKKELLQKIEECL